VTIVMTHTAKVVNTSRRGARRRRQVTLDGADQRRILYA
jgi:hypothetical protein